MAAQEQSHPQGWMLFLHYLAYFVGWLAAAGLAFWIILRLRVVLLDLYVFFAFDPWAMAAVDKFATVLFGLGWLIGVLIAEMWLRQAVTRNRLWPRLLRLFAIETLFLALLYGIQLALAW